MHTKRWVHYAILGALTTGLFARTSPIRADELAYIGAVSTYVEYDGLYGYGYAEGPKADFDVPLFDPSLGTLTQVTISESTGIAVSFSRTGSLENTGGVVTSQISVGSHAIATAYGEESIGPNPPPNAVLIVANTTGSTTYTTGLSSFEVGGGESSTNYILDATAEEGYADDYFSALGTASASVYHDFVFTPATSNGSTILAVGTSTGLTSELTIDTPRTFGTLTLGSCTDSTSIGIVNLTAGSTVTVSILSIGRYGTLNQFGGALSVSDTLTVGSCGTGGTYNLTGGIATINNLLINNAGVVNMSGGSLTASTGITVNYGGVFNQSGGVLSSGAFVNNGATYHTGGNVTFASVSGTGSMHLSGVTVNTGAFHQGPTSIAGTVTFAATAGARQTPAVVLNFGSLSIASGASLDITNHDLFIGNSNLATVNNEILAGFGLGSPGDPAITSSTAIAAGNTFVVPIDADALLGNGTAGSAIGDSWDGVTIDQPGTIIVKYTYFGDVTLDGQVDNQDFATFSGNFGATTPGLANIEQSWLMGDVTVDGVVNGDDYSVILANFGQGVSTGLGALGTTTLPEPGTLLLLAPGILMLMRRKRKS